MKLLTIKELSNGLYENTSTDWILVVSSVLGILLVLVYILVNIDNVFNFKDIISLIIKSLILMILSFIIIAHIFLYFHMCIYYISNNED